MPLEPQVLTWGMPLSLVSGPVAQSGYTRGGRPRGVSWRAGGRRRTLAVGMGGIREKLRVGDRRPARFGSLRTAARVCFSGFVDLLLPEVCRACGAQHVDAAGLCMECNVRLLSLVALPYCPRCGSTLGPNIPVRDDGCAGCGPTLPRFARVIRLGPYADPLRSVIRELKYHRCEALRRRLGLLLGQAVAACCDLDRFDLALPVPMHWIRRLARGYDHAGVLARAVARELRLPVGEALVRVRNTPPQVHLARSRRIENVRGAFAVRGKNAVTGARILLVDDVTTTGATANEAARALLDAGALRVTLAVTAKAEPPTAYATHWQR